MPVHLARGDTATWALPTGVLWLKYVPARDGDPPPTITVAGALACAPSDGLQVVLPFDECASYFFRRPGAASVIVTHGGRGASEVEGGMALERVEER